jgi:transcriptional regulator with XRE-family HTH domain
MARDRTELGGKIREARKEKGWKQKHLAAQVEVEPITVSRWERGATTPDLDVLSLVAEATGKPVSYFVAGEEHADEEARAADVVARLEAVVARLEAAVDRLERA